MSWALDDAQVGELVKHTPGVLQEERQLMEALLEKMKRKCAEIDAVTC